jgi:phosphoglycerate dehydrogenase-like enzyme
MAASGSQVIVITSPLEYEHVERIRAAAPAEIDLVYEPDLLPQTRYIADHKGRDGFRRTESQERRWREALRLATILWDFPSGPNGSLGLTLSPNTKWVQTTSSGVGQAVAGMGLTESDVIVTTARGVHADALAEFALFVMLAHVKDLPRLQRDQNARRWERYCCSELSGKTLTVIGAGQVGARVACLARAFNMGVRAVVSRPAPERRGELHADEVFGQADLKTAVRGADYIVLATPHTPQTEGMIDADFWSATKPGVVFVNIARGQVVDEPALVAALGSGHIGFAGLDVAAKEPLPPGSPLWTMPNVLISPHSASTAPSENGKITDIFVRNLRAYLAGAPEKMVNVLDKARMY